MAKSIERPFWTWRGGSPVQMYDTYEEAVLAVWPKAAPDWGKQYVCEVVIDTWRNKFTKNPITEVTDWTRLVAATTLEEKRAEEARLKAEKAEARAQRKGTHA